MHACVRTHARTHSRHSSIARHLGPTPGSIAPQKETRHGHACLCIHAASKCMSFMHAEALVRLSLPVVFIGAWLNNTPLVLILIPIVASWSRKAGLAPGHLFMPLSFASILGGTATLIGTSTNLVIAGKQRDSFPDDPPIHLFDVTPFGVPVALAGVLYIVLFGPRLLPGKAKSAAQCAPRNATHQPPAPNRLIA